MRRARRVAVLLVVPCVACYHAIITTGRPPGDRVIDRPWASSFVIGIIPPDVIDAGSECAGGVAKVETHHSFLNSLVGVLTIGVYTPITITITCAGSGLHAAIVAPTRSVNADIRSAAQEPGRSE